MNRSSTISSWSGGKDSCLACYKAMQQGYNVKYLLNFISKESKRACFHGIKAKLLQQQAELIGIPLVQKEVTADMKKYEEEFKEAVRQLQSEGAASIVFGDIYLLDQFNWAERVSRDLGIHTVEPLWDIPPQTIVEDFIDLGFKAIVISCKADVLGKEFIGRCIDKEFIKEVKEKNCCPCGEHGEFHTLVVDGPIFSKRIKITKSQTILKKGFWEHWFLDIKEYQTEEKEVMKANS